MVQSHTLGLVLEEFLVYQPACWKGAFVSGIEKLQLFLTLASLSPTLTPLRPASSLTLTLPSSNAPSPITSSSALVCCLRTCFDHVNRFSTTLCRA